MGSGVRDCHSTNAVSSRAATANPVRVAALVQPRCGPSITAHTRASRPPADSEAPGASNPLRRAARDSGTRNAAPVTTAAARGTLIQKAARQENCSTSQPPMSGPPSPPSPPTAAQTAMARARSAGSGNVWWMTASVAGISRAAPAPMQHRAAISCHGADASAPAQDAAPHRATPLRNERRRPQLSVKAPTDRTVPPRTRA